MNRAAPYPDASINRYDAQRMLQNAQFPSRGDKRQQWDASLQVELNPVSPLSYSQGHRSNPIQSLSQERMANEKADDPSMQSYEQDMEIGYEDNKPSELTFEGLEQKLQDQIMTLVKEKGDIENQEIARHKERMLDINTRYQEKLSSIRLQHAARIGEFLRKESQARLHHYQQAAVTTHRTERGPTEPRDYGWPMAAEAQRPYETMPNESYTEHSRYHRSEISRASEGRVPYPLGRVYNNSGASF